MRRPLSSSSLPLPLTLLLVQLAVIPVAAQIQAPACLPAALGVWNWTYNSLNQSPCQIAAYLAAECYSGKFTLPQIAQGQHYPAPSGNDECRCNSVFYSLISGCTGCQKGIWLPYDQWYTNCTNVPPMSTFPQSINNDTSVPAWAFVNVSITQPWDNVTACATGRDPESTGTFRPPFAPKFDDESAVRVGVIVGVVTGCTVLAFVLLSAGIWHYMSRRRQQRQLSGPKRRPPSAQYLTEQNKGHYSSAAWTPDADKRFYDPSDPSTYPDLRPLSHIPGSAAVNKSASAAEGLTPPSSADHPSREYSGLPEP